MALFLFVIIQTYQYIKKKHNSINHLFGKGSLSLRRRKYKTKKQHNQHNSKIARKGERREYGTVAKRTRRGWK
jgi:hypothetical protein